jgi:hypothetical protein
MRTKNHRLNYDDCYTVTSIVGVILFVALLITEISMDIYANKANHEIMVRNRAKLYEQSILEYKGHLAAEKTRATYKAQSQQCCKAIPNKPLPMSAVPMVFK